MKKYISLQFFVISFIIYTLLASSLTYAKKLAFVSILPQKFLVESIAGDLLDVQVLVKPGQAPEMFSPTPKLMVQLSQAKLFFTIGLNFEQLILQRLLANNTQLKIIETQKSIKQSLYQGDPHIWLDPILVKQQIKIIYQALISQFPNDKTILNERYQAFLVQVEQLHDFLVNRFKNNLKGENKKNSFVIFHPALLRFAKRYQLNQIAIEQPGNKNSAKRLAALMDELKHQSVRYIIVEKQFSKKEASTIAKVFNAQLLEIDPLAESWFDNMYKMSKQLHLALF